MKICPKCNSVHEKDGVFCSRSCANSRVRTTEFREKLSILYKGKPNPNKGSGKKNNRYSIECPTCSTFFETGGNKPKKFCSRKCNPNMGGYREGSGRSKSGYYKGVYCGSTYELVWVIYQIDHGIPFSRFTGSVSSCDRRYFPDFLQNGVIVEIKGYEDESSVSAKTKIANDNGFDVVVLRKADLKKEFDYCRQKYCTSEFFKLYDGYAPRYCKICKYCHVEFETEKENVKFCSRSCGGKHRSLEQNQQNKRT